TPKRVIGRLSYLACLLPNHFDRIFVFPDSEKDWLTETIIPGPLREFYLTDHCWFDPVATLHFGSSQPLIPAASASCRKIEKGAFSTRILFNSRKRERKSFSPPYFCPEEITRFTGEPCATELPLAGP